MLLVHRDQKNKDIQMSEWKTIEERRKNENGDPMNVIDSHYMNSIKFQYLLQKKFTKFNTYYTH